jgi:N-glycosylase/DNA lyase
MLLITGSQVDRQVGSLEPSVGSAGRAKSPATVIIEVADARVEFSWGEPHHLGTAAYWVEQTRSRCPSCDHRLGRTLAEETVACLLGGFGLPAHVGLAAFEAVRAEGLISTHVPPSRRDLELVLTRPIVLDGASAPVRYRFPAQRADRIARALQFLSEHSPPRDGHALRAWLLNVPGVGPKTASWIVRNRHGTEGIAIIDVHVRRAGLAAGFFRPSWRLPRDYALFETAFDHVATIGGVSTAALDARIWRDLSFLGGAGRLLLGANAAARAATLMA